MIRRSAAHQRGFTLIEVLMSMSILASMLTLVWGSFSISSRGKERAEAIADRYYQLRLALGRMTREISMAYLSQGDRVATDKPRTFFVSERNSKIDELKFSYLGHMRLHEDAKECDQAVVRYYAASDPADSSRTHLWRQETRRIDYWKSDDLDDVAPAYALLEDVQELHFEFFDQQQNDWRDTWNTRSADGQPDRLPVKVRITLTFRDERDKPMTIITAARIHMREALNLIPK